MRRRRINLAKTDPKGRLDVFLYRMAERGMKELEQRYGLVGLCERVLPRVEDAILENIPARNLLPRELTDLIRMIETNAIPAAQSGARKAAP